MKVLVVIPSLRCGGAERVVSILSHEWSRNHEVVVAVFDASEQFFACGGRLQDVGLPAKKSVLGKVSNALKRIVRLRSLIKRERPQRIICFTESANFPALIAACSLWQQQRVTVSVHCDPIHILRIQRWLIAFGYGMAHRVVAVSRGTHTALAAFGVPQHKLQTIYNPLPLGHNLRCNDAPTAAPKQYILAVGRLEPCKGFDLLLSAFAQLVTRDVHLVILGEGSQRKRLEAMARSLSVTKRVHMPGALFDMAPWYQHAVCFVMSSRTEGFSNVLLEAMGSGCPVVSFACPYGPLELIEHGVNGCLVDLENTQELAKAIDKLVTDESLRARLASNAQRRIAALTVEHIAPQWLE